MKISKLILNLITQLMERGDVKIQPFQYDPHGGIVLVKYPEVAALPDNEALLDVFVYILNAHNRKMRAQKQPLMSSRRAVCVVQRGDDMFIFRFVEPDELELVGKTKSVQSLFVFKKPVNQ